MTNEQLRAGAVPSDNIEAMTAALDTQARHDTRVRLGVGIGLVAAAGAAAWGMHELHDSNARLVEPLPFSEQAQNAVNNIDTVLEAGGEVGLVLTLGTIGGVKIMSAWNPRLRAMDRNSSREMTNDGKEKSGLGRRILEKTAAGSIPVIASAGVALGTLTTGISAEVSDGPSRPIEALDRVAPGDLMAVQYPGAMPMVESNINNKLTQAIQAQAAREHVRSTVVDLNLGTMTYGEQSFSDLSIGIATQPGSPLEWKPAEGCRQIPIILDKSADIAVGSNVELNGVEARVVDTTTDTSAINRVGIAMDRAAMKTCLEQNPDAGDHAVVLDTTPEAAHQIVTAANADLHAPVALITKEQYKQNSETFWISNVKPITNVLALVSGAMALVSMGGAMGSRLLRNRREWATRLARGMSENQLRATELLRSAKDGVIATVIGAPVAAVATVGVNALEAGFQAGVGYKEVMVGAAIGTLGSIGGGLSRLLRPRKTINPEEYTRV